MKENLGFYHLGNGYSVCDKNRKERGDYMHVAHIGPDRDISFYKKLSQEAREAIIEFAKTDESAVSQTQPWMKVFHIPPGTYSIIREYQPNKR